MPVSKLWPCSVEVEIEVEVLEIETVREALVEQQMSVALEEGQMEKR